MTTDADFDHGCRQTSTNADKDLGSWKKPRMLTVPRMLTRATNANDGNGDIKRPDKSLTI